VTPSRREFLVSAAGAAAAPLAAGAGPALNGFEIARRHRIVRDLPTPNFFEGMLLGNGDIGACVTVRPDALGLHLGKEDSWDIRVSEEHYRHVLPLPELLQLWKEAGEEAKRQGRPDMIYLETEIPALREYTRKVTASYEKPWPRPWPCGTVWVHWDSRKVRVVRQTLDPSNGLYRLELEVNDLRGSRRPLDLFCFVNRAAGHVCVHTGGAAPFVSVAYDPHVSAEAPLPRPEVEAAAGADSAAFSWYQHFPAAPPSEAAPDPPRSPKDRNAALSAVLQGSWRVESAARPGIFLRAAGDQLFRLDLALCTPRDHAGSVSFARSEARRLAQVPAGRLQQESEKPWREFWSRSAVELEDKDLERLWYHNQYWLACCLREGKLAPGLFGNWTSGQIGTAWHGDYHMNYNTQQVFWGVFSSNHVEQHLPYVELVENLLPMSEAFARDKFGMPGAFFPHSAYPVPSQVIPYPAPPWGYEICETPWTVQSLWWHYRYTLDRAFLERVYPLLRAAARFLAAYVRKEGDGKYHIVPTVSPENWGFTVDYRLNRDCIMDLALTEFLLDAAVEASRTLEKDGAERDRWAGIRARLAPYPKTRGPHGEVWADVVDAPPEHVYNIPVTLAPVFPGEQVGLGRREDQLEIARRTAAAIRLEGGNDVVYQPLIRARLGMLDLQWFKREAAYCQLPNGVVQDRVRQIDGRYRDSTNFDFMMRMGIWTENLSLPAVLNECMLQSFSGTIRLFPNTANLGAARFESLRAAGAFLVSAAWDGRAIVSPAVLLSERGAPARIAKPWDRLRVLRARDGRAVEAAGRGDSVEFPTEAGERYLLERV
jgi:alpha-L-fucosidase 2